MIILLLYIIIIIIIIATCTYTLSLTDINLDQNSLVQEFISDQYLIHGHTFQTGVYVLMTSIDPLRVYIYANEFNHRLAPEKFSKTNFDDPRSYITDGHDGENKIVSYPRYSRG